MNHSRQKFAAAALLIMLLAACSGRPSTPIVAVPSAAPTIESALTVKSNSLNESGSAPNFTITARIPYLDPATDAHVQTFNSELKKTADDLIQSFKGDVAQQPAVPILAGSSFDLRYELTSQKGNFWSLKFEAEIFIDGAAHPYAISETVNYDLASGTDVTLAQLFKPDANYLPALADYCKAQLAARPIGYDATFFRGADPAPENYQHWNLSNDALVITFDEDQVAPHAAGAQIVNVPFSELLPMLNVQGPIEPYLP